MYEFRNINVHVCPIDNTSCIDKDAYELDCCKDCIKNVKLYKDDRKGEYKHYERT